MSAEASPYLHELALTENPPGPARRERLEAWFDGYAAALTGYAVWNDGEQRTAMGRLVSEERARIELTRTQVLIDLRGEAP